jgi:type III restriction enzyme
LTNAFFDRPILNSPYEIPSRHWELDPAGQPTQRILTERRKAEFISPIPQPRRRPARQQEMVYDEGLGLSTAKQQFATSAVINDLRFSVGRWRAITTSKASAPSSAKSKPSKP